MEIGCAYLGLPAAVSSRIEGNQFIVEYVTGQSDGGPVLGDRLTYSDTFCHLLPNEFSPIAIAHVGISDFKDNVYYKSTGIETYIGVALNLLMLKLL